MAEPLSIVVALRVDSGSIGAFERHERAAARTMARHGGRIERVVRTDAPAGEWFEVHLIVFPDDGAFAAYRADPETLALAAERDAAIAATWTFEGRERAGYGPVAGDPAPATALADDLVPALSDRWRETPERLETTFEFADFAEALDFMVRCAPAIEALDHHPDWSNSHRRVHVVLTTHTSGKVTDLDRRLAGAMDRIAAEMSGGGAAREP